MIRKWKLSPLFDPLVLPKESYVIHVGVQAGVPVIWTNDVDDVFDERRLPYSVQMFATGDTPPAASSHVGTVQLGGYVGHIFRLVGGVGDNLDE